MPNASAVSARPTTFLLITWAPPRAGAAALGRRVTSRHARAPLEAANHGLAQVPAVEDDRIRPERAA